MRKPFRILGIAGSLRRQSYNRSALRAAQQLAPAGVTVDVFELDGIPLFNEDDERQPPAKVIEQVRELGDVELLIAVGEEDQLLPGGIEAARKRGAVAAADEPHARQQVPEHHDEQQRLQRGAHEKVGELAPRDMEVPAQEGAEDSERARRLRGRRR